MPSLLGLRSTTIALHGKFMGDRWSESMNCRSKLRELPGIRSAYLSRGRLQVFSVPGLGIDSEVNV